MIHEKISLKNGGSLQMYLHDDAQFHDMVLVLPGGGYTYCEPREAEPIAVSYFAEGFHPAVLTYIEEIDNVAFQWDNVYNRTEEALLLLHLKSQQWNIHQQRISIVGFSAGGHLALCVAARCSEYLHAVILGYPLVLNSLGQLLHSSLPDVMKELHENMPPVFLYSTWEDHTVPVRNSLYLLQGLLEHHVFCESHIYQWGHHGLALAKEWCAKGNSKDIDERVASWLSLSVSWLHQLSNAQEKQSELPNNCIHSLWKIPEQQQQLEALFPFLKDPYVREAFAHLTIEELMKKSLKA